MSSAAHRPSRPRSPRALDHTLLGRRGRGAARAQARRCRSWALRSCCAPQVQRRAGIDGTGRHADCRSAAPPMSRVVVEHDVDARAARLPEGVEIRARKPRRAVLVARLRAPTRRRAIVPTHQPRWRARSVEGRASRRARHLARPRGRSRGSSAGAQGARACTPNCAEAAAASRSARGVMRRDAIAYHHASETTRAWALGDHVRAPAMISVAFDPSGDEALAVDAHRARAPARRQFRKGGGFRGRRHLRTSRGACVSLLLGPGRATNSADDCGNSPAVLHQRRRLRRPPAEGERWTTGADAGTSADCQQFCPAPPISFRSASGGARTYAGCVTTQFRATSTCPPHPRLRRNGGPCTCKIPQAIKCRGFKGCTPAWMNSHKYVC